MKARLLSSMCCLVAFVPGSLLAGAGEAHVHGRALVQLVQEENRVEIKLTVPAMDVVGFEHPPRSDSEIAAVRQAALTLGDVAALLEPPEAAGCRQQWSTVRSELMDHLDVETLRGAEDEHAGQDYGGHGHSHDHHDDHHHDGAGHADFEAEWHLVCAMPEELGELQVHLFDTLPALERLTIQGVTDGGQHESRLRRGDNRVQW